MPSPLSLAVLNNALWCDTVCRSHGLPGEFHPGLWLNRQPTPRFYPNAVTLAGGSPASQLALIAELAPAAIPGRFSVKDSFAALDLSSRGFHILFEAVWLWRRSSQPRPTFNLPHVGWGRVGDEAGLAAWERAWSHQPERAPNPAPRQFLPNLLDDDRIAFFAACQGERVVAGVVAFHTEAVVGISNLFAPPQGSRAYWAGCVTAVMDAFPGLPVCDYEHVGDLDQAHAAGFADLGPLRVWVQNT
jgi:hypothetical protein